MSLCLDLRVGDTIQVGDSYIRLEDKSGRRIRLVITGSQNVKRLRGESIAAHTVTRAHECPSTDKTVGGALNGSHGSRDR